VNIASGWDSATRRGRLGLVITQLNGEMKVLVAREYLKVINSLYTKLATAAGNNQFVDLLSKVAGLNLNWKTLSAAEFKGNILTLTNTDPLLAPLAPNTKERDALLAITITFAKEHAMTMDLLQLRKTTAIDDKIKVNARIQKAMGDQKDAIAQARAAARLLLKLAVQADRILAELEEVKVTNRDLQAGIKRDREFKDFHQDVAPLFTREMAKLEKIFGAATTDWQVAHNAEVLVPSQTNATLAQVAASVQTLNLKIGGTSTATIRVRAPARCPAMPASCRSNRKSGR